MASGTGEPNEFDEVNGDDSLSEFVEPATEHPETTPWLRLADRWIERVEKLAAKDNMRLLIGLPIVFSALLIYLAMAVCVLAGWCSIETAKDLVVVVSGPGTLATACVGYFFGHDQDR